MLDEIKVGVELTKAEIASYNYHHIRWLLLLDLIGLIILMAGVYISVTHPNREIRETLSSLIIWAALLLSFGLSQPFILFLQIYILKSPAVVDQMRLKSYTFDVTGIQIQTETRTVLRRWTDVIVIKDVGKLFLIYTSPKLAYIIPKRYFPSREDKERFINALLGEIKSNQ
jgi:hypothetical protein